MHVSTIILEDFYVPQFCTQFVTEKFSMYAGHHSFVTFSPSC